MAPEDLAALPPGPELAAVLARVDHRAAPTDDLVTVLEAHSRQLAHEQARMFSVMNEVLHRIPGTTRRSPVPVPFAADEVRAALAWSRRFADRETDLAFALVVGLPLVQAALLAGRIDRGKAVVFADHLLNLSEEQAGAICRRVLPAAPGLTPWQIAERIKKLILELDPEYYRKRYDKAVGDRKVVAYLDAEGAAVITGSGLPAEDAAAAVQRVDALARATRRAGHPNTLDQLRADVFLGLLDGSLHGLTRDQIIATLLARDADPDAPGDEVAIRDGCGVAEHPTGGDGPGDAGPDDGARPHAGARPNDGARPNSGAEPDEAARPSALPASAEPCPARPDGAEPGRPETADTGRDATGRAAPDPGSAVRHAGGLPRAGIEVRVPLSTLLGHDERPGEIPGWGPVTATVARTVVALQRRAEWRWVVVDAEGRAMSDGITRRRPTTAPHTGVRGGVVELQVPEALLADTTGPWAAVIADIGAQHRDRERRAQDLDAHPDDRFPRDGLRRHVQIRDRFCVFRGCRTPARSADQDHTVEHRRGGPTTAADLGPVCRHDHILKTEGGWDLQQPEPGVFLWTSPLGRRYSVRPEPILPPPADPVLREPDPWHDEPADPTERPLDLEPPPRAPPPPPAAPPHRAPLDWRSREDSCPPEDPPPF